MRTISKPPPLLSIMGQCIHILHRIHKPELMTGPITCLHAAVRTSPRDLRIQLPTILRRTCLQDGLETQLQAPIRISGPMGKYRGVLGPWMSPLSPTLWRLISLVPTEVACMRTSILQHTAYQRTLQLRSSWIIGHVLRTIGMGLEFSSRSTVAPGTTGILVTTSTTRPASHTPTLRFLRAPTTSVLYIAPAQAHHIL